MRKTPKTSPVNVSKQQLIYNMIVKTGLSRVGYARYAPCVVAQNQARATNEELPGSVLLYQIRQPTVSNSRRI